MKIALCQMENKGTVRENMEQSIQAIKEAALQKADLILFPEVQLTEFFPQYPGQEVSRYRVDRDSEIIQAFCDAAKENHIMVVPNLYLYEDQKPFDASFLILKDGKIAGIQKMVHVAQANQFFETESCSVAQAGMQ